MKNLKCLGWRDPPSSLSPGQYQLSALIFLPNFLDWARLHSPFVQMKHVVWLLPPSHNPPPLHTHITYTHSRLPGRQSNNWINVSQIQSILKTCSFFFPIVAAKAANGQLSNLGFLEVTASHMCTYTYSQNPSLIWAGVTKGKGAGRVWPAWAWAWLGVEWGPHDWDVFYTLLFSFSIESYLK